MFILEGSIGAGKTTFLKRIAEKAPDIVVLSEPQRAWGVEVDGESLLANFYANPERWFYTMDMTTMTRRIQDHLHFQRVATSGHIVLMERSIYSGYFCYASYGRAVGMMSNLEWTVYSQWAEYVMENLCEPPRGFVYLRASPETCMERVRKRKRRGEENMTLEYLRRTGELHDHLLLHRRAVPESIKKVPVLVVDGEAEIGTAEYERKVDLAVEFMRSLKGRYRRKTEEREIKHDANLAGGLGTYRRDEDVSISPRKQWFKEHNKLLKKFLHEQ